MKEHPIILNTEMVRAVLADIKTHTRRVLKKQPTPHCWEVFPSYNLIIKLLLTSKGLAAKFIPSVKSGTDEPLWVDCPYGKPGDVLWVRERWTVDSMYNRIKPSVIAKMAIPPIISYFATGVHISSLITKWRPSIFLPRRFARIFLKITNIRVERVQDITQEDAYKEGIKAPLGAVGAFADLWDSINEKRGYGWAKNPWVWVIEFERIEDYG